MVRFPSPAAYFLACLAMATPVAHAQSIATFDARLVNPSLPANASMGWRSDAMAADGDRVVLGAYSAERACIFRRLPDGTWSLEADLQPPVSSPRFGIGVAIQGDEVVVGAPYKPIGSSTEVGGVYIYRRDSSGTWTLAQTIDSPVVANTIWFGGSVAISGDLLAIGTGSNSTSAQRVFVYARSPTGSWIPEATIVRPDSSSAGSADQFGFPVRLDGNRLTTANCNFDTAGQTDSGRGYVFGRTAPGVWNLEVRLDHPSPAAGDGQLPGFIATNVALAGNRAVIALGGDDVGANANQGSAQVYRRNPDGSWSFEASLISASGRSEDWMGWSTVGLVEDEVLVGSIGWDGATGSESERGRVTRFRHAAGTWSELPALEDPEGVPGDRFGSGLAHAAGFICVSASSWSPENTGCGVVFGFGGDCNANSVADPLDIVRSTLSDCDGDLVPDQCVPAAFSYSSATVSPFNTAAPASFSMSSVPPAAGIVTFTLNVNADLDSPSEFVTVAVNGTTIGTVTGAPQCSSGVLSLNIPAEQFNFARGSTSSITVTLTASPEVGFCPGSLQMDLAFATPQDNDLDGFWNSCDNCPTVTNPDQADSDGDGTGDACELPDLPAVTVLLNPAFVQNCGGSGCEGTNTVNELAAIGCNVASFTEFTPSNLQTMFAAGRVLVIPEQEVGSLYASLSAATREAFRNAVLAGGRVLVFGTANSRASEIINLLLGSSMSNNANADGSTAVLNTTSVAGTPFASSPATLSGPNATWLAGPWPSTALIAYGSSASAWCAASPAGSGRIGFIAYDVYDPSQASAAAWRTVLDRMLRHLGPSVGVVDADGDGVPDASDNCPAVANPSQADCDSDGLGDACETDPDVNLNGIRDNCETGSLVFAVPQHFTTVGSAIAAATPGSIVRVAPGTYPERINFAGKAITVESTAGAASTILDGGGLPVSIVSFLSGEGPGSVLRGFTIRNGQGGSPLPQAPAQYVVGGGIHINLSSPTIEDCIIEDCFAPWGGGVTVYRSSAVLRRCTFRDNLATGGGGLLLFRAYGALVEDCLLEDNRAAEGGGIFSSYGSSTVRTSDFLGNESEGEGSAIHYRYIDPEPTEPPSMLVQDCIIRTNSSDILGAAVLSQPTPPDATLSIQGSEICDNVARAIIGPYVDLGGNLICECPADANLDGTVDANDLAFILGFWGPCPAPCGADVDRDGAVDANDLALVLGSWGACP